MKVSVSNNQTFPVRYVLSLALFVGMMGVLPHVLYSLDIGKLSFFKGAWDEDFYVLWSLLQEDKDLYRLFGATIIRALYTVFQNDISLTLMTIDFVVPAIVTVLASYIVYHGGITSRSGLLVGSFLMLFAITFFAGTNRAVLSNLVALTPWGYVGLSQEWRMFFPNLMVTFFHLYKTPDPQFSYIVQFGFFAAILRYAQTQKPVYLFTITILCLVLPFVYISVSLALLIFLIGYVFVNILWNFRKEYLYLLCATLCASGYFISFFILGAYSETRVSFIFESHVPLVTPSVIWGIAGLGGMLFLHKRTLLQVFKETDITQRHLLAICCFAMPVLLLNQQLITGVMVRSSTWDFACCYQFIAFGLIMMWPDIQTSRVYIILGKRKRFIKSIPYIFLAIVMVGQLIVYKRFVQRNLYGSAAVDLIEAVKDKQSYDYVMLENPNNDAAVKLRLTDKTTDILAGRKMVFSEIHHDIHLTDTGYELPDMPFKEHGFFFFDQKSIFPEMLTQEVERLLERGLCMPYLMYFFSIKDCWYPLSDYRDLKTEQIADYLPVLVDEYRTYLESPDRRTQFGRILYISDREMSVRENIPWISQLVDQKTIGRYRPLTLYAYLLTPNL